MPTIARPSLLILARVPPPSAVAAAGVAGVDAVVWPVGDGCWQPATPMTRSMTNVRTSLFTRQPSLLLRLLLRRVAEGVNPYPRAYDQLASRQSSPRRCGCSR